MGDAEIKASAWRLVEVGRVILINNGVEKGKLAAIVEIIDAKRVLIDGPASEPALLVPRQAISLSHVSLTPLVLKSLPRKAGNGVVKKEWAAAKIDTIWSSSSWAKNRAQGDRRKKLTDFERFKVMRRKKQTAYAIKIAAAKVKAA